MVCTSRLVRFVVLSRMLTSLLVLALGEVRKVCLLSVEGDAQLHPSAATDLLSPKTSVEVVVVQKGNSRG